MSRINTENSSRTDKAAFQIDKVAFKQTKLQRPKKLIESEFRMPPQNPYVINETLSVDSIVVGHTNQKIVIIENLLQNPQAMMDFANANAFEPYPSMKFNKGYPGVRLAAPAAYSDALMEIIKPVLAREYGYAADMELRKAECVMSLITVKPEDLDTAQLTPHIDTNNYHQFAILLYLCGEEHGGTAFYRHNATGLEIITQETSEHYIHSYFSELDRQKPRQEYFSESNENFTKTGMINAKMNRMVIYRSCMLHSANINPAISITSDPRRGRLTVNSFVAF